MFNQMQNMMATPQAQEMMFKMIAQQVAQAPKEKREALAKVKVTLETTERGMRLDASRSDDPEVEETLKNAVESWTDMLARIFQSMGFQVEIVD